MRLLLCNLKGKPKRDRKTTTRGEGEGKVARYAVYKLRVRHAANEFHAVTLEVWPRVCVCLGERETAFIAPWGDD